MDVDHVLLPLGADEVSIRAESRGVLGRYDRHAGGFEEDLEPDCASAGLEGLNPR